MGDIKQISSRIPQDTTKKQLFQKSKKKLLVFIPSGQCSQKTQHLNHSKAGACYLRYFDDLEFWGHKENVPSLPVQKTPFPGNESFLYGILYIYTYI